ncbi:MAG TPA: hypothetical protein VIK38_12300, partial [Coriobacteriia bacterium]
LSALLIGVLACVIALSVTGPAAANTSTVVTKANFAYDLPDPSGGTVHFACHEIRFTLSSGALELIHCKTTVDFGPSAVIFSPEHLFGDSPWSSDFTGEVASDFRLVGTPSGNLSGWATYHS